MAGSHGGRNDLHAFHTSADEDYNRPPTRESTTKNKICRICGDAIGLKENGEIFVACHECGFPVCRPCYEYERSEGRQSCPQCHTRYKRHKGCPRVEGDDEDNHDDDFDDEFQIKNHTLDPHHSEHGDYSHQVHINGAFAPSVAGSVAGKDFEGEKEAYSTDEWKERVDKWKTRQEKRGLVTKSDDGGHEKEDYDDDFL